MPDQAGALHDLKRRKLPRHRFDGVVELLNAGDRIDLRHLTGHLRVVHRVERVLVVELCHQ